MSMAPFCIHTSYRTFIYIGGNYELVFVLISTSKQKIFWKSIKNESLLIQVYSRIIKNGTLKIIHAFGAEHTFGDGTEPKFSIDILEPSLHYRLALNPELIIGEAYMNGILIIKGKYLNQTKNDQIKDVN